MFVVSVNATTFRIMLVRLVIFDFDAFAFGIVLMSLMTMIVMFVGYGALSSDGFGDAYVPAVKDGGIESTVQINICHLHELPGK